MWQSFVAAADHYSILGGNKLVGYCVVNAENKLLQFSTDDIDNDSGFFVLAVAELNVKGAVVATCEPSYLTLCRGHFNEPPAEIALMYHVDADRSGGPAVFPEGSTFRPVTASELEASVEFGVAAIGGDPAWLREYFTERIHGEELFGLWQADALIATGECRPSSLQSPYADVGMIVSPDQRGRGIATNILRWLIQQCRDRQLTAICSTESGNLASQKAIERSGFVNYHRILEFSNERGTP